MKIEEQDTDHLKCLSHQCQQQINRLMQLQKALKAEIAKRRKQSNACAQTPALEEPVGTAAEGVRETEQQGDGIIKRHWPTN